MRESVWKNELTTLLLRLGILYGVWMVCRVMFYVLNAPLVGRIEPAEVVPLLRGALLFDSISILYTNIVFIVLSMLPVPGKDNGAFRVVLRWLFVVSNTLALLVNMADIFYYPFKLARITFDETAFAGEGNKAILALRFLYEYWYGVLILVLLAGAIYWLYTRVPDYAFRAKSAVATHVTRSLLFVLVVLTTVVIMRGGSITRQTIPVNVSDAGLFTRKPPQTALILSNPFCIIRTKNKKRLEVPRFFPPDSASALFEPVHHPVGDYPRRIPAGTNIVILLLESFGNAHIKSLSDQFGAGQESYTPFFDSLMREGYYFTNAYKNATRSMDALPAIWASIPSFKEQFMAMSHSLAEYHALPGCLKELGYTSSFFHGVIRKSMSLVAFGQLAGIEQFFTRETYEQERGLDDFDGHWGIWDDKFGLFTVDKLSRTEQPFFATYFTLSSHHPFQVPERLADRFAEGTLRIHRSIRYSDYSLRMFFEAASKTAWYNNTLFILVADHGQGSDNRKYHTSPWNYAVPLVFFHPSGMLKGHSDRIAQQIDIMPTLLDMVGYDKPSFAFGNSLFASPPDRPFCMTYYGGSYNCLTDSMMYLLSGGVIAGKYAYRDDIYQEHSLAAELDPIDTRVTDRFKAALQQYYARINRRDYLPNGFTTLTTAR